MASVTLEKNESMTVTINDAAGLPQTFGYDEILVLVLEKARCAAQERRGREERARWAASQCLNAYSPNHQDNAIKSGV